MTIADGVVHGVADVAVTGSQSSQWNLVLLSEGYRQQELPNFAADAQDFATKLLQIDPFFGLAGDVNIFRIDVSSTDSGADDPASGVTAATFFDAEFSQTVGLGRLLTVDAGTAHDVIQNHLPAADAGLVLVNTPKYGGSGGGVAVMSRAPNAHFVGFHELGHTAFGLADEYDYLAGCGIHENRGPDPGPEPANGNVTLQRVAAQIPWSAQLGNPPGALPTTTNATCTDCDTTSYPLLTKIVGAFDGANTYNCNVFRPQLNCRMRNQSVRFCAVCSAKITATILGATWP